jgi:DNA processing protein
MYQTRVYRVLDRDYPAALRELASPPDTFCVRGQLLAAPAVAIVGTRKPSLDAELYAHDLAYRLAQRGVTVWSGGAVGIDAAAHRGALQGGGISVAVIGTGLDHTYPSHHAGLYAQIVLTGGAIVSPFDPKQPPTYVTFPQRNGVLAALTQATVIVQAPFKSGARSTARFARRLGRPLFVVPSPPWEPQGEGNLLELGLGARLLSDESTLFSLLGVPTFSSGSLSSPWQPEPGSHPPSSSLDLPSVLPRDLSPTCEMVFRATSATPQHPDDLCFQTGLSATLVQEALLTLTLEAVLVEGPDGRFRRVNPRKD